MRGHGLLNWVSRTVIVVKIFASRAENNHQPPKRVHAFSERLFF